jgi:RND family efflux transporter MFP subunit
VIRHFPTPAAWFATVGVLALAACGGAPSHETAAPAGAPIAVTTAAVALAEWPALYEAGGVVRARQLAVVSSRVVAPVTEVRVRAGDRVRRGQVLVVLDGRELQAHAARASAAASGSSLGLEAAQAEHQAATAALTLARASFARVSGLKEKNSATAQELDEAQAALSGAEARAAGARARVAEAEQGVAAARASQDATAVGVSYTVLTAPFDGLVAARHADPGTLAAPGSPLLTIEDTQAHRLEAAVDGAQARLVSVGSDAEVRLDGGDWQRARIAEVEHLDPRRHSFLIKVDLPQSETVRSGQFGRVRVAGPVRQALTVPANAVVRRGQLAFVFVVAGDGAARLRMVSTGESRDGRVEVLAGLADGEAVVMNPPATLEDGRPTQAGGGVR